MDNYNKIKADRKAKEEAIKKKKTDRLKKQLIMNMKRRKADSSEKIDPEKNI